MRSPLILLALVTLASSPAQALITPDYKDDFQDGTARSWSEPAVVSSALNQGPAGSGDHAIRLESTGTGLPGDFTPRQRFVMFHRENYDLAQENNWQGNWQTANIRRLELDIRNDGVIPLNLRVAFSSSGGDPTFDPLFVPWWVSTTPVVVPADGLWTHVSFSVNDESLYTQYSGSDSFDVVMQNVVEVKLFSSSSVFWTGDIMTASAVIDNIQAVVPEPSSAALMGVAVYVLRLVRRRALRA
jgi:hypothetical protein